MSPARKRASVKKAAKPSGKASERQLVPQPHGGALLPGAGGGPQPGGGRPRSEVKALAAAKLPRHVSTLDDIAGGVAFMVLREKCPKCGYVPAAGEVTAPVQVKPGEQVRAVEALAKLAEPKEMVITNDRAGAFFDCVYKAIVEVSGEAAAHEIQTRAVQLMGSTA